MDGDPLPQLAGRWKKITPSECASVYPDEIEFDTRGIYVGRRGKLRDEFTLWDSGSYRALDDGRLRLSTATDAQITYEVALVGDRLVVRDPAGCQFEYVRDPLVEEDDAIDGGTRGSSDPTVGDC